MFREITPLDAKNWGRALALLDESTLFLCQYWLPLLSKAYGYRPSLLAGETGEGLAGALPMAEVSSRLTGRRGISLPFIDFCDSFLIEEASFRDLYFFCIEVGKKRGWKYFELRGGTELIGNCEPSLSFYSHTLDLEKSASELFASLEPAARRAIRKARKDGVTIERSNEASAVEVFYGLQCKTRKRHGLPPQPIRFFRLLHELIIQEGKGQVITAKHSGIPVASAIYLEHGKIVHYKYGASDAKYQRLRGNNLVMWDAIEHYSEKGMKELHMGRNSIRAEGLRKYKLRWGTRESTKHYHRYDLVQDKAVRMVDHVYGWHNSIFRWLPNPIVRMAGSLIYRHIA